MHTRTWFPLPSAAIVLALSLLACSIPTPPSSTLPPPPPTITPFAPPTTVPTTIPPPDTPPPSWLPAGTIALYATGPWESPRLHAVAADGSTTDLGLDVHGSATASRTGRWIASAGGPYPADSVVAVNLETGITFVTPLTPDFTLYGLAFDPAETRLALMELGGSGVGDYLWAIVVVNLADGSTTRFETTMTMGSASPILPGNPVGWAASGDELLLDTFMPDTEGNWGGVWGVTLPPGAAAASLDTLGRREFVPAGGYLAPPYLSPDANHLLYLNRDFSYTPAGYEPMAYDLAVNQLWAVDLASGSPSSLVNVTDGGALARAAAWSPDGAQTLFAQGNYAGDAFASLTLKVRDSTGTIRDIGPAPLPPGGGLRGLDWCIPDTALATVTTADYEHQLHTVDVTSGGTGLVTSATHISVLGCVP